MQLFDSFESLNLSAQRRRSNADLGRDYDRDGRRGTERKHHRGGRRSILESEQGSIMDVLNSNKQFSMICELIEKSGENLRNELESEECTFFAPTNDALKYYHELVKGGEGEARGNRRFNKYGREVEMPKVEDILKYHIVNEKVSIHDLMDGELLETQLKSKALGDKNQLINVKRVLTSVVLNNFVTVGELNMKASNGYIHPVEFVLIPPTDAFNVIFMLPFVAGIFGSALQHCELDEQLMKDDQGLTILVPADAAWKEMNCNDLLYLFSPLGCKDLKKIMQYHICTEINYAVDIIEEEKEFEIPTMLKDEDVKIKVLSREKGSSRKLGRKNSSEKCPSDYLIVINDGEASVKCADVIASNGNLHIINSVLVPDCVVLPSRRLNKGIQE